jgi:MFS family permease
MVSLRSAMSLIGPLSAGVLLGVSNSTSANLSLIFSLDGLSFLISGLLLIKINVVEIKRDHLISIKQSITDAFSFFWRHKNLRNIVFYVAGIGFFIAGPINVALPFFIKLQLSEGPDVLGYLLSAEAMGMLAGAALAGKFQQIGKLSLGQCILFADFIAGLCLILLSFIPSFSLGLVLLFTMGVLTGFVQISLITWIQLQVSKDMLGRLMSIVMFTIVGLAPISTALCGYILSYIEAGVIFILSGISLMAISVSALLFTKLTSVKRMEKTPPV